MTKEQIKSALRAVNFNFNERQYDALCKLFLAAGESGGQSSDKKVVLTRAEYTMLANTNALDEDTLYLVLEAQTEIITTPDDDSYDFRVNDYNNLTIDILQPSTSSGGGIKIVA